MKKIKSIFSLLLFGLASPLMAQDANLKIPDLRLASFFGSSINGWHLMLYGSIIILITLTFSLVMRHDVKKMEAHSSMKKSIRNYLSNLQDSFEKARPVPDDPFYHYLLRNFILFGSNEI